MVRWCALALAAALTTGCAEDLPPAYTGGEDPVLNEVWALFEDSEVEAMWFERPSVDFRTDPPTVRPNASSQTSSWDAYESDLSRAEAKLDLLGAGFRAVADAGGASDDTLTAMVFDDAGGWLVADFLLGWIHDDAQRLARDDEPERVAARVRMHIDVLTVVAMSSWAAQREGVYDTDLLEGVLGITGPYPIAQVGLRTVSLRWTNFEKNVSERLMRLEPDAFDARAMVRLRHRVALFQHQLALFEPHAGSWSPGFRAMYADLTAEVERWLAERGGAP